MCKRKTAAGEALLFFRAFTVGAGEKGGGKRLAADRFNAIGWFVQLGDEKRETKNSPQLTLLF
ncbi:MAG: hypothetical protein UDG94_05735 [Peptococcaceae bacterium]|nr:hypothetical protein [Peptococcaceae bacterium]